MNIARSALVTSLASLTLVASTPHGASASCIGVFAEPGATGCILQVVPASMTTWYICAILQGDAAGNGITGAEFRQDNTPAGWFMTATPNPAASVSLGNPLTGGVNIAFPSCQGPAFSVLLYTVSGFATSAVSDVVLQIDKHSNPSNPDFQCALLVLCDAPVWTKICVQAACMGLNSSALCCPLAVEPASWSRLKALYE